MDVASPVRAVIPSLEGPILMVLAGTNHPLNLTEITSMADTGSVSGVRKALLRLTDQGVVQQVPGGYSLNRDHLVASSIFQLLDLRAEFRHRLVDLSNGLEPGPLLLGLFGSYARRDGDADSDIDVLMVTEAAHGDEQAGEVAEKVRLWTGNPCHVVVLSPADVRRMRRKREAILAEWERDLEVFVGDKAALGFSA